MQRHIRAVWGFDGVIVTDDMCMAAIHGTWSGIGRSSVAALDAGVDLVLVAWDSAQYHPVMAALPRAQARGEISSAKLEASQRRLAAAKARISAVAAGNQWP